MKITRALFLLIALAALSHSVQFVRNPSLVESNGKAVIGFSVSDPTDVEVAILGANGKVIRHLATGLLGDDAVPPSPLVQGLSQNLEWDGLDDYGNRSFAAPFKVRVRLGVTPEFERRIHLKSAEMFGVTAFAAWKPDSSNNGWGPDTVVDTSEIIDPRSPVLLTGTRNATTGLGLWDGSGTFIDMCVSNETDDIILEHATAYGAPRTLRINGRTGQKLKAWSLNLSGFRFGEPVMDWFGRFYYHDRGYGPASPDLYRISLEGVAIPYSWGTNIIDMPTYINDCVRQQGFCNDQYGNIYQAHWPSVITDSANFYVRKWDSLGGLVNDTLITLFTAMQGVQVDLKGNIFIAVKLKPLADTVPKHIRGLLSGTWEQTAPYSQAAIADEVYGSIVKFGPQGGSITRNQAGGYYKQTRWMGKGYAPALNRLTVNGAQWIHYGSSFVFNKVPANNMTTCGCYNPRFNVDRFGRVLYPDPFNNCFRALDNNGNLIYRVHNRDLFGQVNIGSVVNIQSTDRALYLGDHINNQVVVMTWKAEAETTLTLATAGLEKTAAGVMGLLGASPNPFTPSTALRFSLAAKGPVEVRVVDPRGRLVRDFGSSVRNVGVHALSWNGRDQANRPAAAGVYCFVLKTGERTLTERVLLVR